MTELRPTGAQRFLQALAGELVAPSVTGLTFVEPALLSGSAATTASAGSLGSVCAREDLDFAFVDPQAPWSSEAALLPKAGVAIVWVVPGLTWHVFGSLGVVEGLRAAARGVDELSPLLDEALDRAVVEARRGIAAGATAIVVADDMAGASGPLFDPAFLREAVFPRLARVVETARAAGLPAILHCDGDARTLMADARAAGFVAIHGDAGGAAGLERSFFAARAAGLAFVGGVPTAELSGAAGPGPARWRARTLAREGGLLVADDGGITNREEAGELIDLLRALRSGSA